MAVQEIELELLRRFEQELDPECPEKGPIPIKVLGYGEISTVLEIGNGYGQKLAYKRMSMFKTEQEADQYEALHREYLRLLQDPIGLSIVPSDLVRLVDTERNRITVYIIQEKLSSETIAHKVIHQLSPDDARILILAVVKEIAKVFNFNRQHIGHLEVGFDGQISNWALVNFNPAAPVVGPKINLTYFDTSIPLVRKNGQEQINPELFLRCAPSFLVPILRLLFLKEVIARYYDIRKVAIDLLANLYKEQRTELVPVLVDAVNEFFAAESLDNTFKAITVKEVSAYYREDAWIWRLYLAFRKIDRSLYKLRGKQYPYILPGKIKR